MRFVILAALVLLLPTTCHAQTVTGTAITVGPETWPRYRDDVLVIPEGEVFEFPQLTNVSGIEIFGTARVSREHPTVIACDNITIYPTGWLDQGTVEDPVLVPCRIEIKGNPLLPGDVEQMTRGIQNLGRHTIHGVEKTAWTRCVEVLANGTTLMLADVPSNWKVGDELEIPDTQQISLTKENRDTDNWFSREPINKVKSINGNVVELERPLTFDHLAAYSPGGELRHLPFVANISRNIVLTGDPVNRAHTVNLHHSLSDRRWYRIENFGRTTTAPLDPTTNRVARYPLHGHHQNQHTPLDHDHPGMVEVGTVVVGSPKWGIVFHQTHHGTAEQCVVVDCRGAGIVTEDGNEVGNKIRNNFVIRSLGNGMGPKQAVVANAPGAEGAGYWFHSSEHIFEGNVAANCAFGTVFIHLGNPKNLLTQGDAEPYDPDSSVLISSGRNMMFSNRDAGLETWSVNQGWIINNPICWHNGRHQINDGNGQVTSPSYKDVDILASGFQTTGIKTSFGYTLNLLIDGGIVEGCQSGMNEAAFTVTVRNVRFNNAIDIDWRAMRGGGPTTRVENVRAEGEQKWVYNTRTTTGSNWEANFGPRVYVTNWQGQEGNNYTLYSPLQAPEYPAQPAVGKWKTVPADGLTMKEAYEQFGVAVGGAVAPDDYTTFDDFPNFIAVNRIVEPTFGPPRAVLIQPNHLEAATVNKKGNIEDARLFFTGEPIALDAPFLMSIDDGPLSEFGGLRSGLPEYVRTPPLPGTEGEHIVRTVRLSAAGVPIPESEMEFRYFVGEAPPPPPVNTVPILESIEDQSITKGESLQLRLVGLDLDEDQELTFTATASAGVVQVDGDLLTVTPQQDFVGDITVNVTVTDGIDMDSDSFILSVLAPPPSETEVLRQQVAALEAELAAIREQLANILLILQQLLGG